MIDFLNAVSGMIIILSLMAVGYFMGKKGWMGNSEKEFLSKYILNIAIPCLCIASILNNLDRSMLSGMARMLVAVTVSIIVALLLAALLSKWISLPRRQEGVFIVMCGFSNTIFIGLPVSLQLFGEESIPYVMIAHIAGLTLMQSVGGMLLEHAGATKREKRSIKNFLWKIFSKPPIVAVVIALILLVAELRPPELVMTFMGYVSSTVSPLALIYCGYILCEIGLGRLRFQKGIPLMLFYRLVIAPVIAFGIFFLFNVEGLGRSVLLVISALPVVTQVAVMAGGLGADEEYAVSGSCISIFFGFITIPLWMLLLGRIQ